MGEISTGILAQAVEVTPTLAEQAVEINSVIFANSTGVLGKMVENWPNILGAIGILLVGWIFSSAIEKLIKFVVHKIRLKFVFERLNFQDFLDKAQIKSSPLEITTGFLKAYILLMFFLAAANLVGLTSISEFLDSVVNFLPRLVIAVFILLIGFSFSNTICAFIENTMNITNLSGAKLTSVFAKYIVLTFTILAALMQIEIAPEFVDILFIGVVATFSIGLGLAFGLGGSKFVARRLEELEHEKK